MIERLLLAHMRRSDLIESYYSNLTDEVETESIDAYYLASLNRLDFTQHLQMGLNFLLQSGWVANLPTSFQLEMYLLMTTHYQ